MSRKIMLLGGSEQQVIAVKTARQLGYYTVLCDYLPDNPGQEYADKYYPVSTTDKQAVLEAARREGINGIVTYSSDPAAPTAAYVAEMLGLPGVPRNTAECFCKKHLFRQFLKNNGFHVPASVEIKSDADAAFASTMSFPLIVKPTDGSGSKGVSVIYDAGELPNAISFAREFSRNGILIAEEFIERDHPDVIEAEIFVVDGEVAVWGLINSIRDRNANPLLPAAYSYPLRVCAERVELVKQEISRLVRASKVRYGAFNMEMIISRENKLYFLDVGPRNGGNMLPEFIGGIMGQDLVAATINAAMGSYDGLRSLKLDGQTGGCWGLSVIHSHITGIFDSVVFSPEAQKCLKRVHYFKKSGDSVNAFSQARDAVGLAFFNFPNEETGNAILRDFEGKYIQVKVRK